MEGRNQLWPWKQKLKFGDVAKPNPLVLKLRTLSYKGGAEFLFALYVWIFMQWGVYVERVLLLICLKLLFENDASWRSLMIPSWSYNQHVSVQFIDSTQYEVCELETVMNRFPKFLFFIWKKAHSPVPRILPKFIYPLGENPTQFFGEKVLASEACFFVTVFSCSLLRGMITAGPEMAKLAGILRASFGMAT